MVLGIGMVSALLLVGCADGSDQLNSDSESTKKYTMEDVEKREKKTEEQAAKKSDIKENGKWYEVGDKFKDEYDLTGIIGYERDHNGLPVGVSLEISRDTQYDRLSYTYTLMTDKYVKLKLDRNRPDQYIVKVSEIDTDRNRVQLKVEEVN